MAKPTFTHEIQYYMDISDTDGKTPSYVQVTEDTDFNPSIDLTSYDPKYKDRINQPSYNTGKTTTVSMTVDIVENQDFQDWLLLHEDDINVPTSIVRAWVSGADTGKVKAKKADFAMTENPVDGASGEAARATGTLSMTSDGWVTGTFDLATKAFEPTTAGGSSNSSDDPKVAG